MNRRFSTLPGMLENVLELSVAAVSAIDSGKVTLDDTVDHLPDECRRTLSHLLSLLYRYRKSIRRVWVPLCRKMPQIEVAALLDSALTQCFHQTGVEAYSVVNVAVKLARRYHADKFVNAILRSSLRNGYTLPEKADEILPDELLKHWQKQFSAETIGAMARIFLEKPQFTFRLCRGAELPAGCAAVPSAEPFRFACGVPGAILNSPEFASGAYYIQDPATSLSVSLAAGVLGESRNVLDICAAPGGKTLMAAELLTGGAEITAADVSAVRQKLTAENFARHHLTARIEVLPPEKLSGSFDLVIADLPCSNSGVFRRRPDALWRFSKSALAEVMKLQRQILQEACRLTAPGKWLLISTCSIDREENEALLTMPQLKVLKQETWLPDTDHDGAFAALCQKLPL
ncbi:MAG: methyltransferase domain-containing protein [Lentisphaeria bacterium]|nr:methyltransferase domain-containing protein [Lentisphaeria bacterium]